MFIKDIPLFVLAGGFGTRLSSVVNDVPKPLADINGAPFLEYMFTEWYGQNIRTVVLLVHHKHELLEKFVKTLLKKNKFPELAVRVIVEDFPLGTAGCIANAIDNLNFNGAFLATNADTWIQKSIYSIMSKGINFPTILLCKADIGDRYHSVDIDGDDVVTNLSGYNSNMGNKLVNTGVYLFNSQDFSSWSGGKWSLEDDLLPILVNNRKVHSVKTEHKFIDIGIPEDYIRFKQYIVKQYLGE